MQFSRSATYKPNEAIQLTNAKIFDANGANNLDKIDFGLQKEGGEWTDISDVTTFIPDCLDNRQVTFNYTFNGLMAGKYQLKAMAYDLAGAASNEVLGNLFINNSAQAIYNLELYLYIPMVKKLVLVGLRFLIVKESAILLESILSSKKKGVSHFKSLLMLLNLPVTVMGLADLTLVRI